MFFGTWIHTLKSSMPNVFTWVMTSMISEDIIIGDTKKRKEPKVRKKLLQRFHKRCTCFLYFEVH